MSHRPSKMHFLAVQELEEEAAPAHCSGGGNPKCSMGVMHSCGPGLLQVSAQHQCDDSPLPQRHSSSLKPPPSLPIQKRLRGPRVMIARTSEVPHGHPLQRTHAGRPHRVLGRGLLVGTA